MSKTTLKPETEEMGRVTVSAKISNLEDLWLVKRGELAAAEARNIEISDALVDTGCTCLGLPVLVIENLGLDFVQTRSKRTANGPCEAKIYSLVKLEIADRDCKVEVQEIPDDCPVLIGQIPLEIMDFVVDPKRHQLIGNPAHGGEWMNDMY